MLTVRYGALGLRPGDRVLDLGAGAGRHAFEAARLGARVVALDADAAELAGVRATLAAMGHGGQVGPGADGRVVRADALRLPFPDGTFDRVVAAEVLEHVPDDAGALGELARVLRPGGTVAVTVPAWFPERVCWALAEDYHAPAVPGGHVRIYRRAALRAAMGRAGLAPGASHRAHALHSPYWWLRCAVGLDRPDQRAVAAYRRLLEWDIVAGPRTTRWAEAALQPVLGKSLVVYGTRR